MRIADETLNKQITLLINDKEHAAFKMKCAEQFTEMATEMRRMIREYIGTKRKSKL